MLTFRQVLLLFCVAVFLAGCATGGGDPGKAPEAKFRLSDGVVGIIEEEGRIDLAADPRVACVEDRVTGSQRLLRVCATYREWRSETWRSQFGNLSSVNELTDLQHHPSAIIQ